MLRLKVTKLQINQMNWFLYLKVRKHTQKSEHSGQLYKVKHYPYINCVLYLEIFRTINHIVQYLEHIMFKNDWTALIPN